MRKKFPAAEASLRVVALCALLAGLAACAPAYVAGTVPYAKVSVPARNDLSSRDLPIEEPANIETRAYPYSPTVAVVGWVGDDRSFGLRTSVRRDGTGATNHRLYVSSFFPPSGPFYDRVETPGAVLKLSGVVHDAQACSRGRSCTPYATFGASIPDTLLRQRYDGMAITFYSRDGRQLDITVSGEFITAYLSVVDSLSATIRKSSAIR